MWTVRENDFERGWYPWQSLGKPDGVPVITGHLGARVADPSPVLVSHADQSLEIFVVRNDLTVWHTWQVQPGGDWSGWKSLGRPGGPLAGTVGPLVAGINADGSVELFTTDADGAVQTCRQSAAGAGAPWSDWNPLGSPTANGSGARLAVVRNGNGELELFMVGPGGTLWHRWQNQQGTGWSNWASLGQPALGTEHFEVADLAVVMDRGGGLDLWATSPVPGPASAGSPPWLWLRTQAVAGSDWYDWYEYPLKVGSTTTRPIEGPVLAVYDKQVILMVRESGTSNIFLVSQISNSPSPVNGWDYEYLPF